MGLLEFLSGVTGFDKTSIPSNVRGFIEEVNKANRTREPWHPEAPIRDSMQGYEKGSEKILEFKRGIQRFGILTQEFDFNPSFGDLHASNWYFHVDDILPSVEVLMNQGSAQIQGIFGAHMIDMFNYANQYGVQNDYGEYLYILH